MKKKWLQPKMEDLSLKETAMSPSTSGSVDSTYIDDNGNCWISHKVRS